MIDINKPIGSRGGSEVLPYVSHIGMCNPKGYGWGGRFGLKTGIHFAHFGLESGYGFRGNYGSACINQYEK